MCNAPVANWSTAEPLDNAFVVVPFNIFVNRLLEFRKVVEFLFMSVKKFLLQLRKEILGLAVVQAVALSRHGLDDAMRLQILLIRLHLILPSLIRM